MQITTKSGKEARLTIFDGDLFIELKDPKIHEKAEIVNLRMPDKTKTPALRIFVGEEEKKTCIPISEEQKKKIESWLSVNRTEEALVCTVGQVIE